MLWLFPFLWLLQTHPAPGKAAGAVPPPKIAFRVALRDSAQRPVFAPNGKWVATGSSDGSINLWEAHSGELLHTMHVPHEVIYSLAFSPDSATLASGSSNGILDETPRSHALLWDTATGKLRRQLGEEGPHGYQENVAEVVYLPKGNVVAVCGRHRDSVAADVDLWDAQTGVFLHRISEVHNPAFSPDGHTLAAIFTAPDAFAQPTYGVKLWDIETGALKQMPDMERTPIQQLLFSPDGKTLAGAAGIAEGGGGGATNVGSVPYNPGKILLWDMQTGAKKQILVREKSWIYALAFSPDSKTLASAQMETHRLSPGTTLSTTVRGTTASGEAVLWDVATGKSRQVLPCNGWIDSLAYSPDGSRLVTAYSEHAPPPGILPSANVSLWNPATGALLHTFSYANFLGTNWISYAPDGKLLVTCGNGDGSVRWLRSDTLNLRFFAPGQQDSPLPIAFSPDGRFLVSGGKNSETALLWNLRTGRLERRLLAATPLGWTTAVAVAADSKTIATLRPGLSFQGIPGTLSLWDAQTGRRRINLKDMEHPRTPAAGVIPLNAADVIAPWNALAFTPDGRTLITGGPVHNPASTFRSVEQGKEGLVWWNVPLGTFRFSPQADTGEVFAVATAPNGSLAATSGQYETILWDAATGKQLKRMRTLFAGGALAQPYQEATNRALAFSPDSKILASGDTNVVRLWDVADGTEIGRMEGHTAPIHAIAYSPDGTLLASASEDGSVRLWDLSTRKTRNVLAYDLSMTSVAFSPDGRLLASGSADGTLHFWNARTGAPLLTIRTFPARSDHSPSAWISYTPEGYYEGSSDIKDYLRWQIGDHLLPATAFERRYHRRDRIEAALKTP